MNQVAIRHFHTISTYSHDFPWFRDTKNPKKNKIENMFEQALKVGILKMCFPRGAESGNLKVGIPKMCFP